jgi:hypothetical protein
MRRLPTHLVRMFLGDRACKYGTTSLPRCCVLVYIKGCYCVGIAMWYLLVPVRPFCSGTGIRDQKTVPDAGPDPMRDVPLVLMSLIRVM